MKKAIKRLTVVALSALMAGTVATSLASCGTTTSSETITVYVFAGTDDQETNEDLVNQWAESYSKKLVANGTKEEGYQISTKCYFESDTTVYFDTLIKAINAGSAYDIFYVSPKYVKAWSKKNRILELSQYIDTSSGTDPSKVFGQALGLYSYDGTNIGDSVHYDSASGKFINDVTGEETGVYAFPKDYSTFGLGYNANYFEDSDKKAYESTPAASGDVASDGKSIIRVASTGKAAPGVVNIGVPTTYYPYNFYMYNSYAEALAAGDPVAIFSDKNGGYTVTIPGYPGETYTRSDPDTTASYNDTIGYITYTYAEYGAITWALTYYYNQLQGLKNTTPMYGNDQYEGTLYLLPWLAGNSADYINSKEGTSSDGTKVDAYTSVRAGTYQNGDKTVTYGIDSDAFIETYAAFCAYGSDWNGNSFYCGNQTQASGYTNFMAGNLLFYGIGTWDAAGYNGCSTDLLTYRLMPEPVGESYALYSRIKDEHGESKVYSTDGTTSDSSAKASYSDSEIIENQETRQEQWAGRVDSVGYGVNADVVNSEEWKAAACVDLAMSLTLNEDSQIQLTYSGSQLPNFEYMVEDYVGDASTKQPTGTFADAITPDSPDWDEYYELQQELVDTVDSKMTLAEYMAENHSDMKYNTKYGSYTMKKISTNIRAFLVLNMLGLDYNSRNLCLRMVEGVNGVTDSATYTYTSTWLTTFANNKGTNLVAWTQKAASTTLYNNLIDNPDQVTDATYCTPYAYCKHYAEATQTDLDTSVTQEKAALGD